MTTKPTQIKPTAPMTRRGPDGRPQETEEMEQRATEAEKADAERPRRAPVTVVSSPD